MDLTELGWDSFFETHFEPHRDKGFSPARIALEERSLYVAYSELGELTGKVTGRFRHNAQTKADFPTVGDWVVIKGNPLTKKMTIHGVLPRKSNFSRMMLNRDAIVDEQVISANVDVIVFVHGLDKDVNVRTIERYVAQASASGAALVIVLNKVDVCDTVEEQKELVKSAAQGAPVIVMSALEGDGVNQLYDYVCTGRTAALVGSSGVGKSTIINGLLGEERQTTGAVSEYNFSGRHITVKRELIILPGGGLIIDNPGMRTMSLDIEEGELDETFDDIVALASQCKFKDCQHNTEPGCAIRKALEDCTLDRDHYRNYLKLQRELKRRARYMDRKNKKS